MSLPVPKTAMVFAAGLGTRMRPITETLPKPLVEVHGRTLIDYCLDRLAENGVERAIVNVHWLPDQIEAQLAKRRAPKIIISDERSKLLDQGGGIKRALPLIGGGPFLICHTDALWIEGPGPKFSSCLTTDGSSRVSRSMSCGSPIPAFESSSRNCSLARRRRCSASRR